MREKKIYQEAYKGNCVFVGYDENKSPKYCSKCGTSLEKPFKGDQDNSDKSYPFSMEGMSEWLFVLESPIDVMSHATLTKLHGSDYRIDHRISLGCLSDVALERYLSIHPKIKRIIFALDDDANGKAPDGSSYNHGQEAALRLYKKYEQKGYLTLLQIPEAKDFNEELMVLRSKMATLETGQDDNETEDEDEDEDSLSL